MSKDFTPSGSSIYQRTHKGQIVAAGQTSSIDPELVLWLRMVNGLTPTHTLMTLAGASSQDTQTIIGKLLNLGLIQPC